MLATQRYLFRAVIFVVFLCVASVWVYGIYNQSTEASLSPQKYWAHRIAIVGAEVAYAEFAAATTKLPQPEQHLQAHFFGEALYRQAGIAALATCDDRFSWGCFHQFIGLAISEHGTDSVRNLRNTCRRALASKPNACIHSIGHGVLAHLGYTSKALGQALEVCEDVPNVSSRNPVPECYRGTFMEFNLRSMLGEERNLREVTETGLYYPCTELVGEQKRTCFYVQSQWWRHMFAREQIDERTTFVRLGELCSKLSENQAKNTCYEGIGTTIAWDLGHKPEVKATLCEVVSTHPDEQLLCKLHLAYWLSAIFATEVAEKKYQPEVVCKSLKDDSLEKCFAYTRRNIR